MALSDLQIRKKVPTGKQEKLSDSGGLFLLVHPNGGKYWRMSYRFNSKQKTLSIGTYPTITLLQSRTKRRKGITLSRQNY